MSARRVLVLRHGRTAHNAAGVWQGQLDTELDETGRAQAARTAAALAGQAPARILSSDLHRAADTAAALGAATGVPVEADARLREIDVGRWQGLSHADVAERYPVENAAVHAGEDLHRGIDGERVVDVVARARPVFDDLVGTLPPGGLGVVVTHGVTARALVLDVVGIDQHTGWRALSGLDNARWAALADDTRLGGWRLTGWNLGPDAS